MIDYSHPDYGQKFETHLTWVPNLDAWILTGTIRRSVNQLTRFEQAGSTPRKFETCPRWGARLSNFRLDSNSTGQESSGARYRNHLPAMTAIDVEVGIRREYHRIGHCLGHAHQAGVSKTHRYACVFLQERYHCLHVVVQIEPRNHGSPRKHRVQS